VKTKETDQLQWVVLLLAVAVILPTVCLLWFMTQAVRNERLAVRQKLLDICNEAVEDLQKDLVKSTTRDFQRSVNDGDIHAMRVVGAQFVRRDADSVVIYDKDGKAVFPVPETETSVSLFYEPLASAFALEQAGDFTEALAVYQQLAESDLPAEKLFDAYTGQLRCLEKLGRIDAMSPLFNTVLHTHRDKWSAEQIAMLRVIEYEVLAAHWDSYPDKGLLDDLEAWYRLSENYPSATTVWALGKILTVAETISDYDDLHKSLDEDIEWLKKVIRIESLALTAADYFAKQPNYRQQFAERWYAMPTEPLLYSLRVAAGEYELFFLRTQGNFISSVEAVLADFPIPGTQTVVYDHLGRIVYGKGPLDSEPFVTADLDAFSPGWSLALYFDSDDSFSIAAERQAAIYTWTGVLVAGMVVLTGLVAVGGLGRQIRLNRLKNDFIATITHELKTPLASMRVLVDTLREGNYNDQQQAAEYLRLISKENIRLSRLIDNFLTFSRMERNKQAFDIAPASPVEIANIAIDAVYAKFEKENVRFEHHIIKPLPMIKADKDAMATVLVNLLDNAYKYSYDNKRIELSVYRENACVCFSVKDNGIGMTHRQTKKAFDRFYQADSSLSRRTEGTGLGLAIVKFIVHAHQGQVEVQSKPAKGSVFTVRIPTD